MDIKATFDQACNNIEYNRLTEAREMLESILIHHPDFFPGINKLGVICIKENNISRARDFFLKALDINPDYVPSIVNMGSVCNAEGDINTALELYKKAIEKDKDYYIAYYNIAVICKKLGNYDEYMKYLKQYRRSYKKHINDREKESSKEFAFMHSYPVLIVLAIIIFVLVIYVNR